MIKRVISALLAFIILSSVCVSAAAENGPKLSRSKLLLSVGRSFKLKVSDTSKKVRWTSSDRKVATVSTKGTVKAKSAGKAVITAFVGKKKLTCRLSVKTLLVAHRGFSSEYPENTLNSFKAAFENGFDGIEIDLWESKNGDLMIFHDSDTSRMCSKKKYIWKINKNNRSHYPIVHGNGIEKYSDKKLLIPTLSETARLAARYNGRLLLHIKTKKALGYKISKEAPAKIAKILEKYGVAQKTTIFTRSKKVLKTFLKTGIKLGTTTTPDSKEDFKNTVKWCVKKGVKTLVVCNMTHFRKFFSLKKMADYCRDKELDYGIYTTLTSKEFYQLQSNGAHFSMSDYKLR